MAASMVSLPYHSWPAHMSACWRLHLIVNSMRLHFIVKSVLRLDAHCQEQFVGRFDTPIGHSAAAADQKRVATG